MRLPDNTQLLDLWDAGCHATPMQRALLVLGTVYPDERDLAQWPLGRINAALLALRAGLFGPHWPCLADCPHCGAVTESGIPLQALLANPLPAEVRWCESDAGGAAPRFRLPVAADVLAAGAAGGSLAGQLVDRAAPAESTAALGRAMELRIEQHDPLAHIAIALVCPACGQQWQETLHAIDLLWTEIGALAQRVLSEVGRLAQSFGWREADILALTPLRRQHYLDWLEA